MSSHQTFYGGQERRLTAAERLKNDIERRHEVLRRHVQHHATLDQRLGTRLDNLADESLRRLFDLAFGQLAQFEWDLQVRRRGISKPQRSSLLQALSRSPEFGEDTA